MNNNNRWGINTRQDNQGKGRDIILKIARNCFEKQGIDKSTMNDIANNANISRRTLHRYFPNKPELIQAVLDIQAIEFFDSLKAAGPENSACFIDKLRFYLNYSITKGPKAPGNRLLFGSKNAEAARDFYFNSHASFTLWRELLENDFNSAQKNGEIRSDIKFKNLLSWLGHIIYVYTLMPIPQNELSLTLEKFVLDNLVQGKQ